MRTHASFLLFTLCALTIACSGFANPDAVSHHISDLSGVEFEREGGATVGKTALRLTRIGISAANAQAPEILDNLKDFQVGVYRPVGSEGSGRHLTDSDFARYATVVALETQTGEDILLLSRSSRGHVRELLAVIDGRRQLTVIQVRGDLEEVLEEAIRMAFSRADRDDLATPVLDSIDESIGPIDESIGGPIDDV